MAHTKRTCPSTHPDSRLRGNDGMRFSGQWKGPAFQLVERDLIGPRHYPVPTAPMHFSDFPLKIRKPAPFLGEHNEYVLGELLGMSQREIQSMSGDQVIGTEP